VRIAFVIAILVEMAIVIAIGRGVHYLVPFGVVVGIVAVMFGIIGYDDEVR